MCMLPLFLSLMWGGWSVRCNPAVPCPAHCVCHLDLRLDLLCSNSKLTDLPSTLPPDVQHLNLSFNQLAYIEQQAFRSARQLRILLLNNNQIQGVADGAFAHLEALLNLDLSQNNISWLGGGFSLGLGSLRDLSLANNHLESVESSWFAHLDALLRLDLSGNRIHSLLPRTFMPMSMLRRIRLDRNSISNLSSGAFAMLRNLEELRLQRNKIVSLDDDIFSPLLSLVLLDLANNQLIRVNFKAMLSIHAQSTRILLEGNPWMCDCDLQRVFRKLQNVQRLLLDDYKNLTCQEPMELRHHSLEQVDPTLCIAETITILIITLTVVITVVAAIVMGEKNRKKQKSERHWTEVGEMSFDSQD